MPYANVARCCGTCPFRADITQFYVPTDVLDATVGENLRNGYAHNCHRTSNARHPMVCAGFLRFTRRERIHNPMVELATRLDLMGPVDETAPLIAGGWADVLNEHHRRAGLLDGE